MPNASMMISDQFESAREEEYLSRNIEYFIRTHSPQDPELAHKFSADLTMLVRRIYIDASRPAHKELMAILEKAMPFIQVPR